MKSSSTNPGLSKFYGVDPVGGDPIGAEYSDARLRDIDSALSEAASAAERLRLCTGEELEALMEAIAACLEEGRDEIVRTCQAETGYPPERVAGEFGRMVDGMRLFGRVAERGDWLDVRIDHGDPARDPLPKPDLRRMQVPIGPVVVFGASNFPLALSVGGSDVASALAAGCPVVAKGHPSHPGTSELLAAAILDGVSRAGFPAGTFAMVQGVSNEVGQALVEHPEVRAVAFTGSLAGGRAIFDLAARREVPVPVYAEMGSVNPQLVLPELLATDAAGFANRLFAAATMGNGQFCTNPGLVFTLGAAADFLKAYCAEVDAYQGAPMLNAGIAEAFRRGVDRWRDIPGLAILAEGAVRCGAAVAAAGVVARIKFEDFMQSAPLFQEEVFGPATVVIECQRNDELMLAMRTFGGQLGASLHGTEGDLASDEARSLLSQLSSFAGRVLVNGFPTGLETCHALQHGGPYPATTDPHWTSVGTAAIERFGRPLAFQNVPDELLPEALKEANPLGLRRLVDGEWR